MEELIYTITLSDGTVLSNLRLNGNNYVSQDEVTDETFERNLSHVIISDGETEQIMENAELIQIAHYSDGWYFILRETPEEVLEKRQLQADVDYIAAMTGVEL